MHDAMPRKEHCPDYEKGINDYNNIWRNQKASNFKRVRHFSFKKVKEKLIWDQIYIYFFGLFKPNKIWV